MREGRHVGEGLGEDLLRDDDVEPPRVGREDGEDQLDGNVLHDQALVAFGGGLHRCEPFLARADGGHLCPPLAGEPEGPFDCDLLGVLGDRADKRDVAPAGEAHARHAPREVELRLHALERGLAGRGDEHGVRLAARGPRGGREGMPEAADGVSSERDVRLVDGEPVQAGNSLDGAAGLGHQLRADSVAGETGDLVATGSHGTAASRSKTS